MDDATVVVDKFADTDPEQARWHAQICESFTGTKVSVVATPWDHALATRVPLDLGAVAGATLDAKLAMADVVLRGADRANRKRNGLLTEETQATGNGQRTRTGRHIGAPTCVPDGSQVRITPAQPAPRRPATSAAPDGPGDWPEDSDVRIIPAQPSRTQRMRDWTS